MPLGGLGIYQHMSNQRPQVLGFSNSSSSVWGSHISSLTGLVFLFHFFFSSLWQKSRTFTRYGHRIYHNWKHTQAKNFKSPFDMADVSFSSCTQNPRKASLCGSGEPWETPLAAPPSVSYTISPPGGSVTVGGSTNLFPSTGITGIFMSTLVKNAIFSLK